MNNSAWMTLAIFGGLFLLSAVAIWFLSRKSKTPSSASPDTPLRVLVVDDNQASLLPLRAAMDSPLYRMRVAASTNEALTALRNSTFDLIILDYLLEDAVGPEILATLDRAWSSNVAIPVIGYTASHGNINWREHSFRNFRYVETWSKQMLPSQMRKSLTQIRTYSLSLPLSEITQ